MNEPETFTQGDTVQWTESFEDYPASNFTLTYVATGPSNSNITITATANGDDYVVTMTPTISGAFDPPGLYSWYRYVTDGQNNRYTNGHGEFNVLADPTKIAPGQDQRDHYRIVLDAINAVIEGRATQAEEEFSIAGRSLRRTPLKDLLGFKLQYERLLAASQEQEKIDNGEHSEAGMVHYRFQNPYGRILPH